jgi:hypothetical protein
VENLGLHHVLLVLRERPEGGGQARREREGGEPVDEGGEAMSGICDTFSGSITGDVLTFNPDAIPKPDTLFIHMTRGEHRIADELRKQFGGFDRVIIDVDGEQHEFRADSFIGLLESYEHVQGMNNYTRLFGTPERAARTLDGLNRCDADPAFSCDGCTVGDACVLRWFDYDAMLEWLKGGA